MRTRKTITSLLGSLLVAGCFIVTRQASAQGMGYGAGQYEDRFVINEDESNHYAHLRLQTHDNRAWNVVNQGNGNDYGSLWWGYAPNDDDEDLGSEKMRLYNNGNLRTAGKLISGTGGGLIPDAINWSDTRGIFVNAGSDNAFFGLRNRDGQNVGTNAYNTVLYFGDDTDDNLEFRSYGGELMRLTGDGKVGIGIDDPQAELDVVGIAHFSGSTSPSTPVQGAYIGWNALTGGTGEMDFINHKGGGTGGFAFYNTGGNGSAKTLQMLIDGNGNVGIGTASPVEKLEVTGNIKADGVILNIGTFPDYVFEKDYPLMPLSQVESYVKTHKHLPGFPSEAEVVKTGANLGQINNLLVEKVEELTLYTIAQEKQIKALSDELALLKAQLGELLKKQ